MCLTLQSSQDLIGGFPIPEIKRSGGVLPYDIGESGKAYIEEGDRTPGVHHADCRRENSHGNAAGQNDDDYDIGPKSIAARVDQGVPPEERTSTARFSRRELI